MFYTRHEPDLVLLKNCPNFNLTRVFREAICAYVRNEEYSIEIPSIPNFAFPFKNIACHLHFSDEKDADVIRFINTLRRSYGTCALKAILRSYINGFSISPYLEMFSSLSKMGIGDQMIMFVNGMEEIKRTKAEKEEIKQKINQEIEKVKEIKNNKSPKSFSKPQSDHVSYEITPEKPKIEVMNPVRTEDTDNDDFDVFGSIDKMIGKL